LEPNNVQAASFGPTYQLSVALLLFLLGIVVTIRMRRM
jgi:hypothetical protein